MTFKLITALVFHLGDPNLDEEPRHCVPLLLTGSLGTLIRPRQGLLLQCQRLGRMGFPGLQNSALSCRSIALRGGILPIFL